MKKIYFLSAIVLMVFNSIAQIEGTWRLAPAAGSLAVGPNQGDGSWWSNSAADVTVRACLFDDSITFASGGAMTHYMDGSTWVDGWQGSPADGCNTPVAPHDGTTNAPYSYSYNSTTGELTVNGIGAHLGLAKVINGAEINTPANAAATITYLVSFSNNNNTMTADISIGGGWWRFVYQRTNAITIPDPNITFRVNMSNYTGTIGTGVYVNGSFNGWCGSCNPLNNMGNGVWQATLPIPAGNIEYKFTVDGWTDQENFTGTESCIDPINDGFYNRYLQVSGDVTLSPVCFASCDPCPSNATQLIGTWKLKGDAGSLAVGPALGDGSWWSNSIADVTTRACLFDDSIKFDANGTMTHYMDGNTWLEAWQGATPDGCGTPVAPHNGVGPFTYTYSGGELTINGIGGHIGLAKVYNGGELSSPANAPASVTYQISFANNDNIMIADINFGLGWWRFIYEKTVQVVVADPNITFSVDMTPYTGTITQGVFINGDFNGWCGTCTPLTNTSGNLWEATLSIPVGPIQYKFTIDGWNDQENFTGTETCIDPVNDGFFNRYYDVTADATLPAVCFASCDPCQSGLNENSYDFMVYPNPSRDFINVESELNISKIAISAMSGKEIIVKSLDSKTALINISNLPSGLYLINISTEKGKIVKTMIKE
jgi:hypothetical protein